MSTSLKNDLGGTSGFGENQLVRGDDSPNAAVSLTGVFGASGLNFFGKNYTTLYVNNNGNLTFTKAFESFTPTAITATGDNPIILPMWYDVDTTGSPVATTPGGTSTGTNLVYWDLDATTKTFTATWDDVARFDYKDTTALQINAFQVELKQVNILGDFDITFRYEATQYGSDARAGWTAADGKNWYELPQSGNAAAMTGLSGANNVGIPGTFQFAVRNGSSGPDVIRGGMGDDVLSGGGGDDQVIGRAGNDSLDGGPGDDFLVGGAGTDTFNITAGKDRVADFGWGGTADILRVEAGATALVKMAGAWVATSSSYNKGAVEIRTEGFNVNLQNIGGTNGIRLGANGPTGVTLVGSNFADIIAGGDGGDTLQGGLGGDVIVGRGGDDIINGEGDDDELEGSSGLDTFIINAGSDRISDLGLGGMLEVVQVATGTTVTAAVVVDWTPSAATYNHGTASLLSTGSSIDLSAVTGSKGWSVSAAAATSAVNLVGSLNADTLTGGDGDDSLNGQGGADTMSGGRGNDVYVVNDVGDVVTEVGNSGTDAVQASVDYTLPINVENLMLTGPSFLTGTGNALGNSLTAASAGSRLVGGAGADTLIGGLGDDILEGGTGFDSLQGGNGADIFRFFDRSNQSTDTVSDFGSGLDSLEFSAASFLADPSLVGVDLAATNRFVAGTTATAAQGQFIYDSPTGRLMWDQNGTAAGQVFLAATLGAGTVLVASDIRLIS